MKLVCEFKVGMHSVYLFYHEAIDIAAVVYGDYFILSAEQVQLQWATDKLSEAFEMKDRRTSGPDSGEVREMRILSRIST